MLKAIYLYTLDIPKNLKLKEIMNYISEILPKIKIENRGDFLKYFSISKNNFANKLAEIRITDIKKKKLSKENSEIEDFYEGFRLAKIFANFIEKKELNFENCNIVFTSLLFGTWEDNRYHARTSIYSLPNLISTSGIVEAPAKPRGYYIKKQSYLFAKLPIEEVEEEFKEKFISYNDERLTEVVKGYVLQAIFFNLIFNPFCKEKNCRLFNAHWQEDMINCQLNGKLCERHEKILRKLQLNKKFNKP